MCQNKRVWRLGASALIVACAALAPGARAQQTITRTYTYDANGTLVSRSDGIRTDRFVSDARRKLIGAAVQSADSLTHYRHDADGERVTVSNAAKTVNQLVDSHNSTGYSQVIEQNDRLVDRAIAYAFGQDRLSLRGSAENRAYHADGQHSTRQLTSAAGDTTDEYRYDAFGNTLATDGDSPNDFRFAGEQHDPATDTYYLRARNYAPGLGQFTSLDPFTGAPRSPQSLHKYAYAHSDPVNLRDPTGRFSMTQLMVSVAIVSVLHGVAISSAEARPGALCELKARIAQDEALAAAKAHRAAFLVNYTEWFGAPTASNVTHVEGSLDAIIRKLNDRIDFVVVDRSCPISAPEVSEASAFAFPSMNRVVLCNAFCNESNSQVRARIIYHEAHHLALGDTGPETYGPAACRALAINDPTATIHNADSFSFAVFGDAIMLDFVFIDTGD